MQLSAVPALLWLCLSGLLFAGGEYFSKRYILAPHWSILFLLLLLYCVGALAWLPALQRGKDLSVVGTLWSVIGLCLTVLIGVLIFGERLTLLRGVGIGLSVLAIVLLSMA
jgi:multidrug transporter EmrE-like cation transporter